MHAQHLTLGAHSVLSKHSVCWLLRMLCLARITTPIGCPHHKMICPLCTQKLDEATDSNAVVISPCKQLAARTPSSLQLDILQSSCHAKHGTACVVVWEPRYVPEAPQETAERMGPSKIFDWPHSNAEPLRHWEQGKPKPQQVYKIGQQLPRRQAHEHSL